MGWLGNALAQTPEIAYWPEPRHVWSWGNWFRPDDVLNARDARPAVVRYIRRRFAEFVRRAGAQRLCEKTPGNCLRVPFVNAVYPRARILLLVRDGRHVVLSMGDRQWRRVRWDRLGQRLAEVRLQELPAFLGRVPWFLSTLCRGRPKQWGTRPPGWRRWFREDSPEVAAAKQWAATITKALDDLVEINPARVARIRYEELVTFPRRTLESARTVLGLRDIEPVIAYLERTADPAREARRRTEMRPDQLETIRPHIESVLQRLGYEW